MSVLIILPRPDRQSFGEALTGRSVEARCAENSRVEAPVEHRSVGAQSIPAARPRNLAERRHFGRSRSDRAKLLYGVNAISSRRSQRLHRTGAGSRSMEGHQRDEIAVRQDAWDRAAGGVPTRPDGRSSLSEGGPC